MDRESVRSLERGTPEGECRYQLNPCSPADAYRCDARAVRVFDHFPTSSDPTGVHRRLRLVHSKAHHPIRLVLQPPRARPTCRSQTRNSRAPTDVAPLRPAVVPTIGLTSAQARNALHRSSLPRRSSAPHKPSITPSVSPAFHPHLRAASEPAATCAAPRPRGSRRRRSFEPQRRR